MPIQVLPMYLVNKIAAGEVIERPGSVVKELVENALDAGATRIDIAAEDGGKKLISVTDNGAGMTGEDLGLALRPHTTSKIAEETDLYRVATMGFRGEALASIASISHAQIRTGRRGEGRGDDSGYEVEASGETIGEVRPCAAAPGTAVTIRDLFFNTPARRKFLRTANTEFGHITEQLARLALPRSRVAFTLTHNHREVQNLPAAETTAQRVADLFGTELSESLLPIVVRTGKVNVAGLLGPPSVARSSGKWQYFFLNGRYIRDRLLAHAVRETFRGLIEPSRFPVALLFLEIDPGEVDVNVHPTKIEVRFRDAQLVHGEVLAALRETLNKANLTPAASLERSLQDVSPPGGAEVDEQRRASLRQALADFFKSTSPPQPRISFPGPAPHAGPPGPPGVREPPGSLTAPTAPTSAPTRAPAMEALQTPLREAPEPSAALHPRAIQIHNTYIVTDSPDGLLIIDQHALHERILYNDIKRRLAEGKLASQKMLIPETMDVTGGELEALQSHADLLGKLGVEVVAFGPRTAAVQQFPSLLTGRGISAVEILRDFLDMLSEEEPPDAERLLEELLQLMACKAAVKAGKQLSPEEIDDLLRRRETTEKASSCPHGRPTTLKLTQKDLEKQFKRT